MERNQEGGYSLASSLSFYSLSSLRVVAILRLYMYGVNSARLQSVSSLQPWGRVVSNSRERERTASPQKNTFSFT